MERNLTGINAKVLGFEIRKVRESQDLTQRELASLVGIAQASISRIEHGDNTTYRTLRRIANSLSTPVSYFISSARQALDDDNAWDETIAYLTTLDPIYQPYIDRIIRDAMSIANIGRNTGA